MESCNGERVLINVHLRQVCADTIVGNQMVRGISGGQRKRVTTGEMVVGPMKTLLLVSPPTCIFNAPIIHDMKLSLARQHVLL